MSQLLPPGIANHLPSTRRLRQAHLVMSRVLVLAVMGQLALGIIALPVHRGFGLAIGLLSLALALTAEEGGLSTSTVGLSVALLLLVCLQGFLIAVQRYVAASSIVHLVNGFVIFGLSLVVAIESEDEGKPDGAHIPYDGEPSSSSR
ncbi:MAG TPA: hypothetical protein VF221_04950 [Chloroflexota bacterium]